MIVRQLALLCLAPLLSIEAAHGQVVPEGIHSDASAPSTMCGVTAADAREFEVKVRADQSLQRRNTSNERFVWYASSDESVHWVFATPTNFVYPVATCRQITRDAQGSLYLSRDMRCDGSREQCDRAYLEFQWLDDQIKQGFSGKERG